MLGIGAIVANRRVNHLVEIRSVHLVGTHHGAVVVPLSLTGRDEVRSLAHHLLVLLPNRPSVRCGQQVAVPVLIEGESRSRGVAVYKVLLRITHKKRVVPIAL